MRQPKFNCHQVWPTASEVHMPTSFKRYKVPSNSWAHIGLQIGDCITFMRHLHIFLYWLLCQPHPG